MSSDLLDDWDETFLEQAIQLELDATATSTTTSSSSRPNALYAKSEPPTSSRNPTWFGSGIDQSLRQRAVVELDIRFSPPRELSQRSPGRNEAGGSRKDEFEGLEFGGFGSREGVEKEREIERLKREIGRVSKQLAQVEHECSELQKDKTKKDAELRSAFSQLKAKDTEIKNLQLNLENSKLDHLVTSRPPDNPDIFAHQGYNFQSSFEDKGCINGHHKEDGQRVLTEKSKKLLAQAEPSSRISEIKRMRTHIDAPPVMADVNTSSTISNCGPTSSIDLEQRYQKKAMGVQTEFDTDCAKEDVVPHGVTRQLAVIWGFPCNSFSGGDLISKLFLSCSVDFCELFKSHAHSVDTMTGPFLQSLDAAKVSHLSETLVKVSTGMEEMGALFEALIDLSMVDNVLIVCRSLRILRAAIQIMFSFLSGTYERSNVILSLSNDVNSTEGANSPLESLESEMILDVEMGSDLYHSLKRVCKDAVSVDGVISILADFRILIVKHMQKIMAKNMDEQVLLEALSIMNLIVMASNCSSERERFGLILLESIPKYLQKDVGPIVHKQAWQLLFLLLNCSSLLRMFCKQCEVYCAEEPDTQNNRSPLAEVVKPTLEALAGCLTGKGNSTVELKLQKKAVIIIAFIASLGNSSAEILLLPVTPQGANFLDLIIQLLASKIDGDDDVLENSQDHLKERFSLMREALILLNRLAANASCSKVVLGALTRSNASASLTVDVASRISQKRKGYWKSDYMKLLQVIEAETIDLARSFRARVLSFIGGS